MSQNIQTNPIYIAFQALQKGNDNYRSKLSKAASFRRLRQDSHPDERNAFSKWHQRYLNESLNKMLKKAGISREDAVTQLNLIRASYEIQDGKE